MEPTRDEIIAQLAQPGAKPCKARELARRMQVPDHAYRAFRDTLHTMEDQGLLVRLKGGRWALSEREGRIPGTLEVTRGGFGFLLPDDAHLDDVYIPEQALGDALNGDRVLVRLRREAGARGPRRIGVVDEILERRTRRLVGMVERRGRGLVCHPEDERLPSLRIERPARGKPVQMRAGDKVLLEITTWPRAGARGAGTVLERLGPAGEPDTETAAILAAWDAPGPFPKEVLDEIRGRDTRISDAERGARLDLTDLLAVTIDPEDARDFDDAISIRRTRDGYVLGVHIADVSHYVREGTALDREARERSTSIYLPARVIPMLPAELSNDACSLRPEEVRPALSVFLHLDEAGRVTRAEPVARSLVRSARRLSYTQVRAILEDDHEAAQVDPEILSALRTLHRLTQKMRARRLQAGAIELELPEARVVLNEADEAVGMAVVEHDFSHQLVEECMLAANVAVAQYAAEHVLPVLYRVHDEPERDDLRTMADFLRSYGYNFRLPFRRKGLNDVLRAAHGRPEEHAINLAVLKSMQQAVYSPHQTPHFALAFETYTHFTSPIRRYPDLHLHQVLKGLFPEGTARLPQRPRRRLPRGATPELVRLGSHTSGRERRAMKIESEVKTLRRLELLAKADQRIHKALVTGIHDFGVFVEIEDFFVDGLLTRDELARHDRAPVEMLPGGGRARARGRKARARGGDQGFHLGEELSVAVEEVSLADRRCRLTFVPGART